MPQFNFACPNCGNQLRRLLTPQAAKDLEPECAKCGGLMQRDASGPMSQVMERLDNGAMPRAVERLADAERLFKERAKTPRE